MNPASKPHVRTMMFLIVFGVFVYTLFENPARYTNALSWLWNVLSSITWGLAIGYILNLIMNPIERLISFLQRRAKHKLGHGIVRTVSVILTIAIAIGTITLIFSTVIPSVTSIIKTLIDIMPSVTGTLGEWISGIVTRIAPTEQASAEITQKITNALAGQSGTIVDYLTSFIGSFASISIEVTAGIFGGLAEFILVFAVALYTISGKENVCNAARSLGQAFLPKKIKPFCFETVKLANEKFSLFFRGQVIEAVILGVLIFITMTIFGFPNVGLISILMASTAIVPVAGPWIGSITSTLLVLITNPLQGLFFAIYIMTLQQIEDNLLYPRIVGQSIGLPGIIVLFAVIVGAKVAGMLGIIVGVPLCAVMYELLVRYTRIRLARNEATE